MHRVCSTLTLTLTLTLLRDPLPASGPANDKGDQAAARPTKRTPTDARARWLSGAASHDAPIETGREIWKGEHEGGGQKLRKGGEGGEEGKSFKGGREALRSRGEKRAGGRWMHNWRERPAALNHGAYGPGMQQGEGEEGSSWGTRDGPKNKEAHHRASKKARTRICASAGVHWVANSSYMPVALKQVAYEPGMEEIWLARSYALTPARRGSELG